MKIRIYAPSYDHAATLAATMNLALSHWEHVGSGMFGPWADVGTVMDYYLSLEENK